MPGIIFLLLANIVVGPVSGLVKPDDMLGPLFLAYKHGFPFRHYLRNRTVEKQKISAVVFDCDGVLIESNAIKPLAFGQTVAKFGQRSMDRLMDCHREHRGVSRFKRFEWFYREVVKAPFWVWDCF